jgi:hypothetical protein
MSIISREDALNIGKLSWDLTAEKIGTDDRIRVAVAFTEVLCEVMVYHFPEMVKDGETILDKIGRAVAGYPIKKVDNG